jgi:hypothetical protein
MHSFASLASRDSTSLKLIETKSGFFVDLRARVYPQRTFHQMHTKQFTRAIALLGLASLSIGLPACSASSQGLSSRNFDNLPAAKSGSSKSQPAIATAPTLNLDLSVEDAYRAIPHRRTAMDFAASTMPDQDKQFLEVAFHLIDQAIRLRVSAYQKFSRSEVRDSQSISDMDRLVDYLQNTQSPASLSSYQEHLLQALSDQRAFFEEWQTQGQQFQYGSPQRLATHPRVQSASTALRAAYEVLMQTYPSEGNGNKEAFFDYHCALDFL